jgi:hypothetical protein
MASFALGRRVAPGGDGRTRRGLLDGCSPLLATRSLPPLHTSWAHPGETRTSRHRQGLARHHDSPPTGCSGVPGAPPLTPLFTTRPDQRRKTGSLPPRETARLCQRRLHPDQPSVDSSPALARGCRSVQPKTATGLAGTSTMTAIRIRIPYAYGPADRCCGANSLERALDLPALVISTGLGATGRGTRNPPAVPPTIFPMLSGAI